MTSHRRQYDVVLTSWARWDETNLIHKVSAISEGSTRSVNLEV